MRGVPLGTAVAVVAGMTTREMVRKRLFAAGALLTVAFLGLYALGLQQVRAYLLEATAEERQHLWTASLALGLSLQAVALYLSTLLVALLAALSSAGSIQGEVEGGILQAVAARPVPRAAIVLGKYLGCLLVFTPYAAGLYAAVVLLARALVYAPGEGFAAGMATFALVPAVVLSLTFALASRLGALVSAAAVTLLLGSAMVGGMLEQIGVLAQLEGLQRLGLLTGLLVPTDALYRRVAAITVGRVDYGPFELLTAAGPLGAASVPSVWTVVYAACYAAALLGLAAWRFQRRDL